MGAIAYVGVGLIAFALLLLLPIPWYWAFAGMYAAMAATIAYVAVRSHA